MRFLSLLLILNHSITLACVQHQTYANSMEYASSHMSGDQNGHMLSLVHAKKQEFAHAHVHRSSSDSMVPSSSSSASSPLAANQDSIAPVSKSPKAFHRQSRLSAFNLARNNKKQKLSQKMDAKQSLKAAKKLAHTKSGAKAEIKTEPSLMRHNHHNQQPQNQQHEPKKRVSANKKERRRTQSINCAFEELRNRIPEIPHDTKLSKIKTLKLATEYIEHLMRLLEEGTPHNGPIEIAFKPDLGKLRRECRSKEIKVRFLVVITYQK